MSGIPEDIRIEASNALNATENMAGSLFSERVDIIAMAILLERETCAKIAEGNARGFNFQSALADGDDMEVGAKSVQLAISDAIRRR